MKIINELMNQITNLGGVTFYLFMVFLLFSLNYVKESIVLFLLLMGCFLLIIIIRSIYFVPRPEKQKYKTFLEKIDASSFPSHHAMRITIVSAILFMIVNNLISKILLVAMALIVSYSRIHLRKHRWADVFAGILIGVVLVLGVYLVCY